MLLSDSSANGTSYRGMPVSAEITLAPDIMHPIILAKKIHLRVVYTVETTFRLKQSRGKFTPEALCNKRLGNFFIEKHIAKGHISHIFKGYQLPQNNEVAIKVLQQHVAPNSKRAKRTERVARLYANLIHPGLPVLYHYGNTTVDEQNIYYFVFDYVHGQTLDKVLQNKKLETREACQIALQISYILAFLHKEKIIYRNLSPSNIMITEDGKVKLVGIGLLKHLGKEEHEELTGCNQAAGVKGYANAVLLTNAVSADETSDIFSLGAVLYHCITGKTPYPASLGIQDACREMENIAIPNIDENLKSILEKSLQVAKEESFYLSMHEFVHDLQSYCQMNEDTSQNFHSMLLNKKLSNHHAHLDIFYKPMYNVGGDFYYYDMVTDDKLFVVVGDVCGHGAEAAILVGAMVAATKILSRTSHIPQEFLKNLHHELQSMLRDGVYAEVTCMLFDFHKKQATISQAGKIAVIATNQQHPKGKIYHQPGLPVALTRNFFCGEIVLPFEKGDLFIATTDGVDESRLREDEMDYYGNDRICKLINGIEEKDPCRITKSLYLNVQKNSIIGDDILIACVRIC